jgi:hypothetical protein
MKDGVSSSSETIYTFHIAAFAIFKAYTRALTTPFVLNHSIEYDRSAFLPAFHILSCFWTDTVSHA